MTRLFLDTEFTHLRQDAQLISLGLVAENGDWFYAECTDFDLSACSDWVVDNVLTLFTGTALPKALGVTVQAQTSCSGTKTEILLPLRAWIERFQDGEKSIQIWADVNAWDWILFCELFDGTFSLPKGIHYIPVDLSTWLLAKGYDPDTVRESLATIDVQDPLLHLSKHHALYDALLERAIFQRLN